MIPFSVRWEEVKAMKKMSVKTMKDTNGGLWKCNYCGKTRLTYLGVRFHQRTWHAMNYIYDGYNFSWSWWW